MVNYLINSLFIEGRFINNFDKLPVYQLLEVEESSPVRSNIRALAAENNLTSGMLEKHLQQILFVLKFTHENLFEWYHNYYNIIVLVHAKSLRMHSAIIFCRSVGYRNVSLSKTVLHCRIGGSCLIKSVDLKVLIFCQATFLRLFFHG